MPFLQSCVDDAGDPLRVRLEGWPCRIWRRGEQAPELDLDLTGQVVDIQGSVFDDQLGDVDRVSGVAHGQPFSSSGGM